MLRGGGGHGTRAKRIMPVPSPEQLVKFVKEFGLAVTIMGIGLWYLTDIVESQRIESTENKTFVRGKLTEMSEATIRVLEQSNQVIQANTDALEDQTDVNHGISNSIARQEVTLDTIDETLAEFTTQVLKDHPEQNKKLDNILIEVQKQ
jgi:hypothetical protein